MTRPSGGAAALERHPDAELTMELDFVLAQRAIAADEVFVVQIGAFDGRSVDPLYAWINAYGWAGILVEPQPRYFAELQQTYAGHDQLELRCVAVADEPGTRTLYTVADEPGVPHWAGLLASFDKDVLLKHREFLPEIDTLVREHVVSCVSINDLLADAPAGRIDVLQIDVEGYDFELLRAVDFARFRPGVVRFEHAHLSSEDHERAVELLIEHGYRVAFEENDTLACRLAPNRASPAGSAIAGPARLQAALDRQLADQGRFYEERLAALATEIQKLNAEIAAAGEWAHQTIAEANAFRERSLEEQRKHHEAVVADRDARLDEAMRRVAELEARAARGR